MWIFLLMYFSKLDRKLFFGLLLLYAFWWLGRGRLTRNYKDEQTAVDLVIPKTTENKEDIIASISRSPKFGRSGWLLDRAVIKYRLSTAENAFVQMNETYQKLLNFLEKEELKGVMNKTHVYSKTFSSTPWTVSDCIKALKTAEQFEGGFSNQFIYILGGTLVIAAESTNQYCKDAIKKKKRLTYDWMSDLTAAGNSRFTWKLAQLGGSIKNLPKSLFKLFPSAITYGSPIDLHGRMGLKEAPTTAFGASATIMKVLRMCEVMGFEDEYEYTLAALCVAYHWSDKHLSGETERHSLIETLQGLYAYTKGDPLEGKRTLQAFYNTLPQSNYDNPKSNISITPISKVQKSKNE
jgi:hypothetical protein